MHWSLPRSKTSPHRHKVLTNGSIMTSQNGGGSQGLVGVVAGVLNGVGGVGSIGGVVGGVGGASVVGAGNDGTSISSKPSVSSDDTGIEVNDHHGVGEADSRDSADLEQVTAPSFLFIALMLIDLTESNVSYFEKNGVHLS